MDSLTLEKEEVGFEEEDEEEAKEKGRAEVVAGVGTTSSVSPIKARLLSLHMLVRAGIKYIKCTENQGKLQMPESFPVLVV
jgi:hypothetical protein